MRDGVVAILDAWNVIHKLPRFRSRLSGGVEAVREAMIRCSADRLSRHRDVTQIWLVFDGGAPAYDEEPHRGIRVIHSGAGCTADEKIAMLVEAADRRARLVVVSDDNEVRGTCRGLGAGVRSVEEFFEVDSVARFPARAVDAGADKTSLSPREEKRINDELRSVWGIDETEDG